MVFSRSDGLPVPEGVEVWLLRVGVPPPSPGAVADQAITATIRKVHRDSRGTFGAPRVLVELRLGNGVHVRK